MLVKEIIIRKPLYGTKVYIRDKELYEAIDRGQMVRVIIPQGSALVDPREWIETGHRMEKVFNIPNKPMVLYGNNVPLDLPTPLTPSQNQGVLF